ncbi:glutathionylspermidine synthase family protein [Methylobacterium sp. C25]|uniref:glutathionylspermidine synthase family protein n=1 Tax=Methylobacterium sp. C25 TaxID=2721622 RepID=UPI001F18C559|nr:glutathionylspermidine synthase family protein [Methylobacterium sp. C25]MCE4226065.1 glutathionylspermidine synthase family protein [Methylobacterium sp. C25]
MRRVPTGERPDWRETARKNGFVFHTLDGAPYWDESHAYAFTLDEIEEDFEAPSGELHALCLDFAARAVEDERILASLRIPESAWDAVRGSWRRGDASLYGRLDLSYSSTGPAKLLEYNADTPTALYETGVFQWLWLEELLHDGRLPAGSDQYNAVHERLIARFREIGAGMLTAFAAEADAPEDRGTVTYLQDCAQQAGHATRFLDLSEIGLRADGRFCAPDETPIDLLFKLYPWEWAFSDAFASGVAGSATRFLEPPWKAVLSNKGLLPHLWAQEPRHPNLLPAFFEGDPQAASLGDSYVRKPIFSREGSNIEILRDGTVLAHEPGPYGGEGYIRQALAELPSFDDRRRPLIGSWIVGDAPAGLCVREGRGAITGNDALFVPHFIEPAA